MRDPGRRTGHPHAGHDATVPKALFEVAGRPFAHWQLDWLVDQGVKEVVYSIGHLGSDRRRRRRRANNGVCPCTISKRRTATSSAREARYVSPSTAALDDSFFVLYGDSYLSIDLRPLGRSRHRKADALMTVYRNDGRFETNNAVLAHGMVTHYEKGLAPPPPEMQFVDYGLSRGHGAISASSPSLRVSPLTSLPTSPISPVTTNWAPLSSPSASTRWALPTGWRTSNSTFRPPQTSAPPATPDSRRP